ncbi:MAG: hypothetical protein MI754_07145 [Chromatiales bacterium]|nr:hypothetical protein [Chromatiales bacterium]
MTKQPENGSLRLIDGKECIFYDGYWIRYYPFPEDTLANRKHLIDGLTKRTFHHTEAGINTPGYRLEEARAAYERETVPARKRVNGAMLAGALFNRATDIFTIIVDLEGRGVQVGYDNPLMIECESCFREALELGKNVKHYSGEEGIDELWGEPLKAFTQPLAHLYQSRYLKIAQTMRDIDRVTDKMVTTFSDIEIFKAVVPLVTSYASASKLQIETMKSDPAFFQVWPAFIASREALEQFKPQNTLEEETDRPCQRFERGVKLITTGIALITYLSEARVPMPKTTQEFLDESDEFLAAWSK